MAVLTLPGAERLLAAHAAAIPQPDQLCGPFAAHVALHALLDRPPGVADLARASGTAVHEADHAEWRPPGVALVDAGWEGLPRTAEVDASGTDARGVAAGVAATSGVEVVPARGLDVPGLHGLLVALLRGPEVGLVANVRTGAMSPGATFDVGHFVVLWGVSPDGASVGVADTYAELGEPGQRPGCRVVTVAALHAGLTAPPGRGLLLLTAPGDARGVRRLVAEAGGSTDLWST